MHVSNIHTSLDCLSSLCALQTVQLKTPPAKVDKDTLFSVARANQLHVYGGMAMFKTDLKGSASARPQDDTLLGAVMANRCPLTYCQSERH